MLTDIAVELLADPLPTEQQTTVASAERVPGRPSRAAVSRLVEAAGVLPERWRAFASCVIARESGGRAGAVNRSSGAAGIAQWMPAWRSGLPYVLARGLRAHGASPATARSVRLSMPWRIEDWPLEAQRAAFAQIIAEGGRSAALRHWHGGHGCDALAAR